jgi:hypothetical protein
MTVLKSLYGFAVLFATLALFVFGLGYFSRYELNRPSAALTSALESSSNVVDRCDPKVNANMRLRLVTYLAIEDYFRPEVLRKVEFMVAAFGARIGAQPVRTIGIGQIAYSTFAKEFIHDPTGPGVVGLTEWIALLHDDCNNVRILEKIAQKENSSCTGNEFICFISSICLWHAGSRDVCLKDAKYQSYMDDVITTYAQLLRMSRQSIGHQGSEGLFERASRTAASIKSPARGAKALAFALPKE